MYLSSIVEVANLRWLISHTVASCWTRRETCEYFFPWPWQTESYKNVSFPVSDIKRTLDAMSWTKVTLHLHRNRHALLIFRQMSQFHWHVVDSHSFPLQVPGFEEVAEKGAYSTSMIYTPADVQEIVSYAAEVRLIILSLWINKPKSYVLSSFL